MSRTPVRSSLVHGFTLLELLIAIVIFALVVSSVYGAYRATFHTIDGTEEQVELAARARVILERLSADLESLYTGKDSFLQGTRQEVRGNRADNLTFTSTAHLVFSRDQQPFGKTVLKYSTEEDEEGLINLYRSDSVIRPGESGSSEDVKGLLLGNGLRAFTVTYVTDEGDELETWDSKPFGSDQQADQSEVISFPVMVKMQVVFSESPESEERTVFRTAVALPPTIGEGGQER